MVTSGGDRDADRSQGTGIDHHLILLILLFGWFLFCRLARWGLDLGRRDGIETMLIMLAPMAIALVGLAVLRLWIWRGHGSTGLDIQVLVSAGLIAYFTPYLLLSDGVYVNDTLWHGGAALHFPEFFDTTGIPYSSYLNTYPGSFAYQWGILEGSGVTPLLWLGIIVPLLTISIQAVLLWLVLRRLLSPERVLIAGLGLLAMATYLEFHVSPHATGNTLLLGAVVVILYVRDQWARWGLAGLLMLALLFVHPITAAIGAALAICAMIPWGVDWFRSRSWVFRVVSLIGVGLAGLGGLFMLKTIPSFSSKSDRFIDTILGGGMPRYVWESIFSANNFRYPVIIALFKIYLILAGLTILAILIMTVWRRLDTWRVLVPAACFGLVMIVMALFLAIADRNLSLVERATTPLILTALVGFLVILPRLDGRVLTIGLIALLALTPVLGLHYFSYNSFSEAEVEGMQYIADDVPEGTTRVYVPSPGQTLFFTDDPQYFNTITLDPDRVNLVQMVYFRSSAENRAVVRGGQEPTNTTFDQALAAMDADRDFFRVYDNGDGVIYIRGWKS